MASVGFIALAATAVLLALGGRYSVHQRQFYYPPAGASGGVSWTPAVDAAAGPVPAMFEPRPLRFAVLSLPPAAVVAALVARELGGRRKAQVPPSAALLWPSADRTSCSATSTDQVFWAVCVPRRADART